MFKIGFRKIGFNRYRGKEIQNALLDEQLGNLVSVEWMK